MNPRFLRRRAAGSSLLFAALLATPALAADPPATANLERMRLQTVRIQVERTDAQRNKISVNGSGVLLCHEEDQAYVLTAHHVIFGESRGPDDQPSGTRHVKKVQLFFYKNAARAVEANQESLTSVFTMRQVPSEDLLLLSFKVQEQLLVRATPGSVPAAEELANPAQPYNVKAIGQATAESWAAPSGHLKGRDAKVLLHSVRIEEGFSGGPLFDEKTGAWIGLNIQAFEDESTPGGRALPIDQVLDAINKWVPAKCLPNNDVQKAEDARDLYRIAMRHVSLREWEQAKEVLLLAIALNPLEGGSVHLQGMRYTEYLPYFHLGLAFYHQGWYEAAFRELQVSEAQGVIRHNKRFKDLQRISDNCRKKWKPRPPGS